MGKREGSERAWPATWARKGHHCADRAWKKKKEKKRRASHESLGREGGGSAYDGRERGKKVRHLLLFRGERKIWASTLTGKRGEASHILSDWRGGGPSSIPRPSGGKGKKKKGTSTIIFPSLRIRYHLFRKEKKEGVFFPSYIIADIKNAGGNTTCESLTFSNLRRGGKEKKRTRAPSR